MANTYFDAILSDVWPLAPEDSTTLCNLRDRGVRESGVPLAAEVAAGQ
jgi:hypothetical protein